MDEHGLTVSETVARILEAKARQRQRLADLPFAEKFKLVVEMHQLSEQAGSAVFLKG